MALQVRHLGPEWNITTITLITMTFCKGISDYQMINHIDFGDPLTFLLAPRLMIVVLSEMSQQPVSQNVPHTLKSSSDRIYYLMIPSGHNLHLLCYLLHNSMVTIDHLQNNYMLSLSMWVWVTLIGKGTVFI